FDPSKDKIYLCGLDTDVCILATCLDLFINNYDIYLLSKLCGSDRGKAYHKAGLKSISHIITNKKLI
ncbi:MAG: cysteine hydrolase, partial [Candidatus Ureaplasma intestinipullorum]|nr:cysteine hydrolase [Candidatus Ureaplasma intestinipullorum]